MNAERRRQIAQLYRAALAQDTAERTTFLADACGADDDFARLSSRSWRITTPRNTFWTFPTRGHHADGRRRLGGRRDDADARPALRRVSNPVRAWPRRNGLVYLADRVDQTFHKRVAIKIVRPGFRDAEIIGRFRQEREILAALDHPTIARVIDGGSTDEGVPYFVMDYVDGQSDRHVVPSAQGGHHAAPGAVPGRLFRRPARP